jgi:c-di-GMP-binding flagellar brake protein YcgR
VFAAPLPASVYRPQRREFFRVNTPTYNPLRIRIPQRSADPLDLMVVDLSCGGIGIHDFDGSLAVQPGEIIKGCGLELPGFGRFVCDLEVRNIINMRTAEGESVRRIGCQFVGLAIDANALIQRYLHKLQLEAKR